jgi:hypothetical protein
VLLKQEDLHTHFDLKEQFRGQTRKHNRGVRGEEISLDQDEDEQCEVENETRFYERKLMRDSARTCVPGLVCQDSCARLDRSSELPLSLEFITYYSFVGCCGMLSWRRFLSTRDTPMSIDSASVSRTQWVTRMYVYSWEMPNDNNTV